MIDALIANLETARKSEIGAKLGLGGEGFAYVTLHRPSNVDEEQRLRAIMDGLQEISKHLSVVFPMHPRTKKMLAEFGISLTTCDRFKVIEPIGYHDSIYLSEHARAVITDSGGLQEETTYFRTPCLTMRPNTERPITIQLGSNKLTTIETLVTDVDSLLLGDVKIGEAPPLWDGCTATRIVEELLGASGAGRR